MARISGRVGRRGLLSLLVVGALVFGGVQSCGKESGGGINIFTVDDDIAFGKQLTEQIDANPAEYPPLSRAQHPEIYQMLERMRDQILATEQLRYKDKFAWEIKVIHADVCNAFCAPGGYIYFYTGILKYLDNEAQVAGILAHEMAHADCRHSTKQMTKDYGLQTLLGMLIGEDSSLLLKIAAGMAKGATILAFSRQDETEADDRAVLYLSKTTYEPLEVAGFFKKMVEDKSPQPPEFLSTHPNHENRIHDIEQECEKYKNGDYNTYKAEYQEFKQKHLSGL